MVISKIAIKEKISGILGSITGVTSIFGSWQVCHNVCLALISLLSIIGITVSGMPLLFLTKIAVPVWITAFVLLLITLGLYLKKPCISGKLIIFNSGVIIFGIPFEALQRFSLYFRVLGSMVVLSVIILFIRNKITRGRANE